MSASRARRAHASLLGACLLLAAARALGAQSAPCTPPTDRELDLPAQTTEGAFADGRARFALRFGSETGRYRVMSVFVLPGDTLAVEAREGPDDASFAACAEDGRLERTGAGRWTWTAPASAGVQRIAVRETGTGDRIVLKAFVMRPYAGEEVLSGYRIGAYERPSSGAGAPTPAGLFEVHADRLDEWLTPHFQLRQFLSRQPSDFPKFVLVGARLLLKLERLLEKVNASGIATGRLEVLSGYRTPHHHRSIGNETAFSHHLYGGAADVYVDRDGDGRMDDLDGDGEEDAGDAEVLAGVVEEAGGLAVYGPEPHRGAFVHVDARGTSVRW